jgi:hypothetical protein
MITIEYSGDSKKIYREILCEDAEYNPWKNIYDTFATILGGRAKIGNYLIEISEEYKNDFF